MKVLVTGADGMLAKDLIPCLGQHGHEVIAPPEHKLDITDLRVVGATVEGVRPAIVINCAAYTDVDKAEAEEQQAAMLNGFAVHNLCLACQESDVPLVHFSTDYVFDGTKDGPYTISDKPCPANAYGRTKLLGEKYVLWLLSRFYLVRTSWLFGLHGKNFIETMLDLGRRQPQLSVVDDQRGCPTWTQHLAEAVASLIETGRYGVYHATNSEATTWCGFAREIFRLAEMDTRVVPITTEEFPRPARRPTNSVLDPFPLPRVLGSEMPSWREALRDYLGQRKETARS